MPLGVVGLLSVAPLQSFGCVAGWQLVPNSVLQGRETLPDGRGWECGHGRYEERNCCVVLSRFVVLSCCDAEGVEEQVVMLECWASIDFVGFVLWEFCLVVQNCYGFLSCHVSVLLALDQMLLVPTSSAHRF
eukprot:TRINITY_DN67798_c4_g5_i1.p3 TRINITY_DN67798_c4_g5~~TRINITY_DN67798_c4_g5_i1.p3  ORF type:complete len:132 (+),score=11.34 TRINITY_DN67798_c4_g5_i1:1111-1506(+)